MIIIILHISLKERERERERETRVISITKQPQTMTTTENNDIVENGLEPYQRTAGSEVPLQHRVCQFFLESLLRGRGEQKLLAIDEIIIDSHVVPLLGDVLLGIVIYTIQG